MVAESKQATTKLYDTDYNLWLLETVKQLQNQELDSLDWGNLAEEILDLSKGEKPKVSSARPNSTRSQTFMRRDADSFK